VSTKRSTQVAQLLYVSAASKPMSLLELQSMVNRANRNNSSLNITGLLLYSAGNFMQLIEGDRARVIQLFEKIEHDTRHTKIELLHLAQAPGRLFDKWSMGLLCLDGNDRKLDRDRLEIILTNAKVRRDAGQLVPGKEVLELLHEFREQLATKAPDADDTTATAKCDKDKAAA
jgi:hypothetical protein